MSRAGVKVMHVITQLELGGAQENTLYTVAQLRPPFVGQLVAGPGGLLDAEASRLPGAPPHFVPSLVRPIRPVRDAMALLSLVRLFRKERPLIVHTHSSKAGILGRVAADLASVPIVVHSVHGFGFNDRQPAPLRRVLLGAERFAAGRTTHFVVVSRANLEQGVRLGLFPRERATLIRSGIPIAAFEEAARSRARGGGGSLRRELGLPGGAPIVGMIACLKPQKSPLTFVDLAARVAAAVPGSVFVLAGDGELREEVRARVAARGLSERFHLLGWRRDVPELMAALDVLVLTSLWEGLPKVIPQAIAAGVPVVATAVDGTTDIIEDGVNGFLAPPFDVPRLASRVEQLLGDPALRRGFADRARLSLPEFDIDAMVRAQEALYSWLLDDAGLGAIPGLRPGRSGLDRKSPGRSLTAAL
jgi:glycosyltransferase involved in cell wall biosynthesis